MGWKKPAVHAPGQATSFMNSTEATNEGRDLMHCFTYSHKSMNFVTAEEVSQIIETRYEIHDAIHSVVARNDRDEQRKAHLLHMTLTSYGSAICGEGDGYFLFPLSITTISLVLFYEFFFSIYDNENFGLEHRKKVLGKSKSVFNRCGVLDSRLRVRLYKDKMMGDTGVQDSSSEARVLMNEDGFSPRQYDEADASLAKTMKWLSITVHLLCTLCMLLVISWFASSQAGYSWATGNTGVFSWHPTLMVFGMVFCYAEAVIAWRTFSFLSRPMRKVAHVVLHTLALVCVVIGLRAVFRFHNEAAKPIPNLYSFHSWLGLLTAILFFAQYLVGFWAFLFPKAADETRAALVPLHARAGLLIFIVCVAATVTTGVLEKLTFLSSCNSKVDGSADSTCYMGNFLALAVVILACVVGTVVSLPHGKSVLVSAN